MVSSQINPSVCPLVTLNPNTSCRNGNYNLSLLLLSHLIKHFWHNLVPHSYNVNCHSLLKEFIRNNQFLIRNAASTNPEKIVQADIQIEHEKEPNGDYIGCF